MLYSDLPIGAVMHVSRWTTSFVCASLLGALVAGCRSRENSFRATRVPVARFDSVLKSADSVRLPLADARLLLQVAADSAFALKAPHDTMTMTDILAWAHAEQARIVRVNPFRLAHQRLRDTPLDKMKLVWQTSDVVFADGSRLSLSAP